MALQDIRVLAKRQQKSAVRSTNRTFSRQKLYAIMRRTWGRRMGATSDESAHGWREQPASRPALILSMTVLWITFAGVVAMAHGMTDRRENTRTAI
jgi:hypothetical protein